MEDTSDILSEADDMLLLRRCKHGGYIVCHHDIYTMGALFFAATTIEEAFAFMRQVLEAPSLNQTNRETT